MGEFLRLNRAKSCCILLTSARLQINSSARVSRSRTEHNHFEKLAQRGLQTHESNNSDVAGKLIKNPATDSVPKRVRDKCTSSEYIIITSITIIIIYRAGRDGSSFVLRRAPTLTRAYVNGIHISRRDVHCDYCAKQIVRRLTTARIRSYLVHNKGSVANGSSSFFATEITALLVPYCVARLPGEITAFTSRNPRQQ